MMMIMMKRRRRSVIIGLACTGEIGFGLGKHL